ncbi:MAG: hypothetical protein K0S26_1039 [Bacteroidota bacterium]|nr:hypothetical protein [Bacteroidota bacterium]
MRLLCFIIFVFNFMQLKTGNMVYAEHVIRL